MTRALLTALALTAAVWLQYSAHFGYDGRLKARALAAEIGEMRERNERLRAENKRLRSRADELKSDPARAEDLARNWLMMIRQGEILFLPVEETE